MAEELNSVVLRTSPAYEGERNERTEQKSRKNKKSFPFTSCKFLSDMSTFRENSWEKSKIRIAINLGALNFLV